MLRASKLGIKPDGTPLYSVYDLASGVVMFIKDDAQLKELAIDVLGGFVKDNFMKEVVVYCKKAGII